MPSQKCSVQGSLSITSIANESPDENSKDSNFTTHLENKIRELRVLV